MHAMRPGFGGLALSIGVFASPASANAPEVDPLKSNDRTRSEVTYYVSGFAGQLTNNSHHEVWLPPWDVEWLDSYILGAAIGFEQPTGWSSVDIGAEAQLVKWFGNQTHWELNAMPVIGRYRFDGRAGPLRSLAFGLGFSYASEVPAEELVRDGNSNRFLIYWSAEIEFGDTEGRLSPFVKLHHRSNAFGLIEEEAGSNTVAIGLRRRF